MSAHQHLKRIRVVLADDDPPMLATINSLLQADFEVVAAVSDGYSLVEAALKWNPDVIVSDIAMPQLNGIEAARRIRELLPAIKFIFLTMHGACEYRREARSVGASGYVLKVFAKEELPRTVRSAVASPAKQ